MPPADPDNNDATSTVQDTGEYATQFRAPERYPSGVIPLKKRQNGGYQINTTAPVADLALEPGNDYVEVILEEEMARMEGAADSVDDDQPSSIMVSRAAGVDESELHQNSPIRKLSIDHAAQGTSRVILPKKKLIYGLEIDDANYDNDDPYLFLPQYEPGEDWFLLEPLGYASELFRWPNDEYESAIPASTVEAASADFELDQQFFDYCLGRLAKLVTPETLQRLRLQEVADPTKVRTDAGRYSIHYLAQEELMALTVDIFDMEPAVAEAVAAVHLRTAGQVVERLIEQGSEMVPETTAESPLADQAVGALVLPLDPGAGACELGARSSTTPSDTEGDDTGDDGDGHEQQTLEEISATLSAWERPPVTDLLLQEIAVDAGVDLEELRDTFGTVTANLTPELLAAADVELDVESVMFPAPVSDDQQEYDSVELRFLEAGSLADVVDEVVPMDEAMAAAIVDAYYKQTTDLVLEAPSEEVPAELRRMEIAGDPVLLPASGLQSESKAAEGEPAAEGELADEDEPPWQDREELLLAIEENDTWTGVADALGCTAPTVLRWVDRLDIEEVPSKPWQNETRLREVLEEHDTWAGAAEALGCSPGTVQEWADKYDIDPDYRSYPGHSGSLEEYEYAPWRDEDELEAAIERHDTWEAVGEELGCTANTASKWALRLGIVKNTSSIS